MSEENVVFEKKNTNTNDNQNKNQHEHNRASRTHNGQKPYYHKHGYHQRGGYRDGQRPQRVNNGSEQNNTEKSSENVVVKAETENKKENSGAANVAVNNQPNRYNKYSHGGHQKDFSQRRKNNSSVRVDETLDDIKLDIERIEKEIGLEIKEISALQFGI